MPTTYKDDEELQSKELMSFKGGYNSYSSSKSAITDDEIPYGLNVEIADTGLVKKRAGKSVYGAEIASDKAIMGLGWLKNTTYNKLIVSAGTAWYYNDGTTTAALTGMAFTDSKKTTFGQAIDRLYGANNTDNLAYTTNGTTVTEVTSNGNIGLWPVAYNQRLYMTNAANPDRIYYSNPINATESSYAVGDFGTYDTNLSATPVKNAGFLILLPGGGLEIKRIIKDKDYIFVYTKMHGIWRIAYSSVNADGSIAHTIEQLTTAGGTPSGGSVVPVMNDIWHYNIDNIYSYGEQANFQSARLGAKSGRIKSEITAVTTALRDDVVGGVFNEKIYFAYGTGSYNDHVITLDTRMNAWSSPWTNISANQFLEIEEDDGTRRFLAGSSNSADSYVYQLESGNDDDGAAISSTFETKSTDCGLPGIIKRFAFIDVFYATVYGQLSYEVFVDEISSVTGTLQLGNSTDLGVGIGTQPIATFPIGAEYNTSTTFADLSQNDSFRIYTDYVDGKKISVRFSNAISGEQFKITGFTVRYLPGSIHEQ